MIDKDYIEEQEKGQQEFNEILTKLKAAIAERNISKIIDFMNDLTEKAEEYEGLWSQADEQWPLVERALEEITGSKFGEEVDSELHYEDDVHSTEIWSDGNNFIHIFVEEKIPKEEFLAEFSQNLANWIAKIVAQKPDESDVTAFIESLDTIEPGDCPATLFSYLFCTTCKKRNYQPYSRDENDEEVDETICDTCNLYEMNYDKSIGLYYSHFHRDVFIEMLATMKEVLNEPQERGGLR